MKIVKVTYTTTAEYAEKNQANIKLVMADLQQLNYPGVNYQACVQADGKTFIHTAFFKTEDDLKLLNSLPSFTSFQQQLKQSGLEAPPQQELLTLIDSSTEIFNA